MIGLGINRLGTTLGLENDRGNVRRQVFLLRAILSEGFGFEGFALGTLRLRILSLQRWFSCSCLLRSLNFLTSNLLTPQLVLLIRALCQLVSIVLVLCPIASALVRPR